MWHPCDKDIQVCTSEIPGPRGTYLYLGIYSTKLRKYSHEPLVRMHFKLARSIHILERFKFAQMKFPGS